MKKLWLLAVTGLAGLVLLTGCVDVEYVGQRFEPLPSDSPVVVWGASAEYPAEEYKVIGRATFTAPDGYTEVDLVEDMQATARKYGADGVKIVDRVRRSVGSSFRQPTEGRQLSSPASGNTGTSADGASLYSDSFGDQVSGSVYRVERYEIFARTLLLMKKDRFDGIMARREEIRQQNEGVAAEKKDSK